MHVSFWGVFDERGSISTIEYTKQNKTKYKYLQYRTPYLVYTKKTELKTRRLRFTETKILRAVILKLL